ncbi:MarR family winged helix-turn-helix transcriptional regulator [Streptococcus pseudoporcinus]|uniref:HTH-type transcriptional regulator SarZ n=1 Tax=Streptococcus pseudoporcinus TaxID=361101 RepID=A0A4U9XJJ9_9STRE|nr:MarR family transcriptional regulator [Streptococcus pseudoporcinus]VTS12441.1 transcription regulator [Streptococcus pseudoporcinus]VUC64968.1 transcription regulator [Streptococcus pseudoporcinus]VUC95603.1 transcription regulator [Streptococcus pseudoporcinus]VUC95999.1 transcription regulator [Streptococcus pseudoporcinus]
MDTKYKDEMKLENQLCFPIYAAARKVMNLYTPHLKPLGLTYTQYLVFLVLWEKDEITVGEICDKLMLDNGTVSPLLKKLQKDEFIEKKRSTEDDRVVLINLTHKGRDLQKKAKDIPRSLANCMGLSEENTQTFYKVLYDLLKQTVDIKLKKEKKYEKYI